MYTDQLSTDVIMTDHLFYVLEIGSGQRQIRTKGMTQIMKVEVIESGVQLSCFPGSPKAFDWLAI